MAKKKHDAEYFRQRRLAKRREQEKAGTYTPGRPATGDVEFPIGVLSRGKELAAMMNTPFCMWPAEWKVLPDD